MCVRVTENGNRNLTTILPYSAYFVSKTPAFVRTDFTFGNFLILVGFNFFFPFLFEMELFLWQRG